jgi:hypothetical protein
VEIVVFSPIHGTARAEGAAVNITITATVRTFTSGRALIGILVL